MCQCLIACMSTYWYIGTVAIKMATGIGSTFDALHDPIWKEAEVSGANARSCADLNCGLCPAMMSMQHECLVKFLGAGVMSEPEYGLRVLFTVQVFALDAYCFLDQSYFRCAQEFMSGGSLDRRIWDQPLCSVTWKEKLQWCKDTAKVWLLQPARGTDWSMAGNGFCAPFGLCPS